MERSEPVEAPRQRAMEIELLGVDRPGLVHEISALLAAHRINVEELGHGPARGRPLRATACSTPTSA